MDTAEKIRILKANIKTTLTLVRGTLGEELSAYILKVHGDGDSTIVTFMDVMEGVERDLAVWEISDIKI